MVDVLNIDKVKENRVRRLARRHGYAIRKSRQWKYPNGSNLGEFMLVDNRNCIVLGSRFDATLDDIEGFLKDEPGGPL